MHSLLLVDAILVMHAVPHGGSHVAGPDPRMQCYFRITTPQRAADRHAALCDIWADWKGMADVVAEERAKETKVGVVCASGPTPAKL